jgi:hypothetical protein
MDYPLSKNIYPGAIFASIAHAIFILKAPFLAHEQSWDGNNYNVQNSEGSRGTIAFEGDGSNFVGVFYLGESRRNPTRFRPVDVKLSLSFLHGLPIELKILADEALQYVLQDIDGKNLPIITAAFWGKLNDSRISAIEPWPDVVKNGAVLIKNQTLQTTDAIHAWSKEFEFTPSQTSLTTLIFEKKMIAKRSPVYLTPADAQQLLSMADDNEGFQACQESLGEIGVFLP